MNAINQVGVNRPTVRLGLSPSFGALEGRLDQNFEITDEPPETGSRVEVTNAPRAVTGSSSALDVRASAASGVSENNGFLKVRTKQTSLGWNRPWSMSGVFKSEVADGNRALKSHDILGAWAPRTEDRDESVGIRLALGFTDEQGRDRPFRISGDLVDNVKEVQQIDWQSNKWYKYEVRYNGFRKYTGKVQMLDSDESDSARAVSISDEAKPLRERPFRRSAGVLVGAEKGNSVNVQHAMLNVTNSPIGVIGV